jgi:cobalt-zinc-cadmium efflux system protein
VSAASHTHDGVHDHGREASREALTATLALTTGFLFAEVVGGLLTGSLALLADAAHMLSDSFSLALALFAVWLAQRPATVERTFGYKRAEILAALANGLTLVIVSLWIFVEALRRFDDPPEILGGWMLAVAVVGLLVNLTAVRILHGGGDDSLNVSAAMRHVIADLLGSVGVIAAAAIILVTDWRYADPLISVLIGLLVLGSAWPVLRDSVRILLEAAPKGLDVRELGREMASVPGVVEVHDLHVWTITSGFPALSAHVVMTQEVDAHLKRAEIERMLAEKYGITHTTLQTDREAQALLQLERASQASERGKTTG